MSRSYALVSQDKGMKHLNEHEMEYEVWLWGHIFAGWFYNNGIYNGTKLTKEQLEELRHITIVVRNDLFQNDSSEKAGTLLPKKFTMLGELPYHMDIHYAREISDTARELRLLLERIDFENTDIYYYTS